MWVYCQTYSGEYQCNFSAIGLFSTRAFISTSLERMSRSTRLWLQHWLKTSEIGWMPTSPRVLKICRRAAWSGCVISGHNCSKVAANTGLSRDSTACRRRTWLYQWRVQRKLQEENYTFVNVPSSFFQCTQSSTASASSDSMLMKFAKSVW